MKQKQEKDREVENWNIFDNINNIKQQVFQ